MLPGLPARAQTPANSQAVPASNQAAPTVVDVTLGAEGKLCGFVVDAQGVPMLATDVTVLQAGKVVARTKTDALGQFSATNLRGGVYQVAAGQGVTTLRAWETAAAPPAARSAAMVVGSSAVVRGQRPFGMLKMSDALILAAIIGAAIAIPIAVSNSDNAEPSSS
jgi:hypothetical protein